MCFVCENIVSLRYLNFFNVELSEKIAVCLVLPPLGAC